jgi:hypothetical protein
MDLRQGIRATLHLGIPGALVLLGASIGVGLVLHPLQFALVQLLEGYWGASNLAEWARSVRMNHHWERVNSLMFKNSLGVRELKRRGSPDDDTELAARLHLVSRIAETGRLMQGQPITPDEMMPTRLGLTLRFYESSAGAPYGLDAIQVMPYLARVASQDDMAYVNDQRSQMDLAVRMSFTAMVACMATITILWKDGLWLLLALMPYGVAYLAYRGAIVAAGQYGRAVAVVIALNRFALYERLRLPLPITASAERELAKNLYGLMDYDDAFDSTYHHPEPRGGE